MTSIDWATVQLHISGDMPLGHFKFRTLHWHKHAKNAEFT
jgi:hypothetical protein